MLIINHSAPLVSLVIPFYNCPYVNQAIESALNQTYQNKEVIVVNDGSSTHTNLIKPYLGKIIYILKGNGGTADALNKGIQSSSGDLIAWLSSDDVFLPTKLEKQVQAMFDKKADLVYTNYHLINEKSELAKQNVGLIFNERIALLNHMKKSCPINGSTVLVKKEAFSKVGGFNTRLKYTHDYDMWVRLLEHFQFH